jgi:GNAT superfamily N-acetyltransferase
MTIRPATRADAEALTRVHVASGNAAYGREDSFERRLEATLRVFDEEPARWFLAEEAGEVVGELVLGEAELYAIYVHPDWWGRGVGQALLEHAHAETAATCDEAVLTCLVANGRARRFYERNGWQLAEKLVEPHFGGEPTEVCRYRRRLSSSRSPS